MRKEVLAVAVLSLITGSFIYVLQFGFTVQANGSDLIEEAIANLTENRSWTETAHIKGEYLIDRPIYLPSYTELDIEGKLTLADNITLHMFIANCTHDICIRGGFLIGNKQARNEKSCLICFCNVSNSRVEDSAIIDACQYGIYFDFRCHDNEISNVYIANCLYQGIKIEGYDNTVSKATVIDCASIMVGVPGIMLTESSYRNKVIDSTAKCTVMAANVQTYGFESRGTYNILANCIAMNSFHCGYKIGGNYNIIEGCIANNSGECGFVTYYGSLVNSTYLTGNVFDGCISVNGKGKFPLVAGGIRIWRSVNTVVSNCLCFNNTFFDIHLDSSVNCTLNGNICFSKTQYQIYVENGADNLLVGNKGAVNDTGTNTKISP